MLYTSNDPKQLLKDMQTVALAEKNDLARPVVIGDIVEELNKRARSYVTMNFYDAQERALYDFQNYMESDVVSLLENDDKVFFERKQP